MPEGPEIRLAADRVQAALTPSPVVEVYFAFEHLKRFQAALEGGRVLRVESYGKAMLTRFDRRLSIYSHNQLYGRWVIRKRHDLPVTGRQLRLAIHNAASSALLYSASDIEVLTPEQIAVHPYLSRLGPDVLSSSVERILQQLWRERYRRRHFGSLFLDQRFIAGIGNYLRSEILFVAGIHPRLRPADCSTEQLEGLAEAAVAVSRRSYCHRGVTNDLAMAEALQAQGQSYQKYRHWVFGRGGEPCRRCDATVIQDTAAGRRVYFCPGCQPGPA